MPALLLVIEGWGYMRPDYAGLHRFEWGYLAATVFAFFLCLMLFIPERTGHAKSPLSDSAVGILPFALFFAAAFGLAVNAWFFEKRLFNLAYWYFPIIITSLALSNFAKINGDNTRDVLLHKVSLVAGFIGLALYIGFHFFGHVSSYQDVFPSANQISANLTSSQRDLAQKVGVLFFHAGLIFLLLSTLVSGALFFTLYLFRRRIGKKWLRNNVVKITLIIIFPLYYWVGALAPDGSDTIFGVDVIYLQMIFFLSSIMASVPIFASEVFFRPASSSGVVSTVLLAAAVYSFTPFVSATIGNFNEAAFCVLVYLTLLLLMAGHAFGGPRWITAFSRFAMVLAVAAAFAGNFLLELGLTEFYREAVLVGLGFACIAFLLAALSFTKRSFP